MNGTALFPHVQRALTTMSDREAHASHLAVQNHTNMAVARRADYLDRLDLRPRIEGALMALPRVSSKPFFRGRSRRPVSGMSEVDQGKASSCPAVNQAKQAKTKPPPQAQKDSGSFKHVNYCGYRSRENTRQ